ncbi:hypothetical protein [Agrococcus versicolor]
MLRLDPALPIIWTSPTTVRIGAQLALATLHDVDDATASLLDRMHRGVVPAEPAVVLGDDRAARLLAALAPVLASRERPRLRVEVTGAGPVAGTLRRVLEEDGHRVARRAVDVSIPVADWRLPDLERQRLLRRDRVHVPVVVGDQRIVVGPWTVPGTSACPRCADLADTRAALPHGLPPIPAVPASAIAQTVAHVAVLVNLAALGEATPSAGASIALATGGLSVERWSPHPECGCRALPGTARASAASAPTPLRATG